MSNIIPLHPPAPIPITANTVPSEVEAAAENYLGIPFNYGTATNLIRIAEHDAFIAGVEWARGHFKEKTDGNL